MSRLKRTRWLWPLLFIVAAFSLSRVAYAVRAPRPLDVLVLDKTVPFRNYLEHRSLFWLLRHEKLVREGRAPYATETDYIGAFPPPRPGDPPERTVDMSAERALRADLVYLADTYGVYHDDLASGPAMKAALERSEKVYGGLETAEAQASLSALSAGKTLVAEFNTLGSPTGAEARRVLEEALGVHWTHWIGRYFSDLDSTEEVPRWMRRDYEREWQRPWDFTGPGYVLLQEDTHCEVLRVGKETERIGLTIERETPVDPILALSSDGIPYPYWFDLVSAESGARLLASFHWHLTPAGRERLRARGLPEVFPAVTHMLSHGRGSAYYFAGDFADNPMSDRGVPFAGYPTLMRWLEAATIAPSEMTFYWRFYFPMMERITGDLAGRSR